MEEEGHGRPRRDGAAYGQQGKTQQSGKAAYTGPRETERRFQSIQRGVALYRSWWDVRSFNTEWYWTGFPIPNYKTSKHLVFEVINANSDSEARISTSKRSVEDK